MASGNDGVRLGAVIDRDLVAERIAARAAPLPRLRRSEPAVEQRAPAPVAVGAPGVVVDQVDYGRVDAVRLPAGLGLAPFVARAAIDATRTHPAVNAGARHVHLGVDGRLVRDADGLRLRALAAAIEEADVLDGATLTIVDCGGVGTLTAMAPSSGTGPAVLTIGRVAMRPVARPGPDGEWTITVRSVGDLALTFEHQVLATGDAIGFLDEVRDALEQRPWDVEL